MPEQRRPLVYYRAMIEDQYRTEAYRRAIHRCVKPGDVVLDLGTGLGILAHFAMRAGASHVYAIESTDLVSLAQEVALDNQQGRVTFLPGWSDETDLPERVDVIVTETLGGFGLDENIVHYLADARRRFLKPGGRLIPRHLRLWIAAVCSERAYDHVAFWDRERYGLHFRTVAKRMSKTPFVTRIEAEELLSQPVGFRSIDLRTAEQEAFETIVDLPIERAGMLHGWVGWFEAELAPGTTISTEPGSQLTHWEQVFLPNVVPFFVTPGKTIRLQIRGIPRGRSFLWHWRLL